LIKLSRKCGQVTSVQPRSSPKKYFGFWINGKRYDWIMDFVYYNSDVYLYSIKAYTQHHRWRILLKADQLSWVQRRLESLPRQHQCLQEHPNLAWVCHQQHLNPGSHCLTVYGPDNSIHSAEHFCPRIADGAANSGADWCDEKKKR
jgi:hypothetical protein